MIVPVRHSESGRFGLLVVTDLWSLRLESQLQFTGQFVDQLSAQLTERNLFGLGKLITHVDYGSLLAAGGVYNDPRVMGIDMHCSPVRMPSLDVTMGDMMAKSYLVYPGLL